MKFRHEPTVPNGPSPLRKRVRWRRPVAHQRFNLHQQIVQPAFSQLNVPVHSVAVGKLPLHHPGFELPNVHERGGQKSSCRFRIRRNCEAKCRRQSLSNTAGGDGLANNWGEFNDAVFLLSNQPSSALRNPSSEPPADCDSNVPLLGYLAWRASRLSCGVPRCPWAARIVVMYYRLRQLCRRNARRLVAAAVLLSFVAALLPLPIFQDPGRDGLPSGSFPCQHHHCGCRNAEQCWKKCCCFTNAQKVAWAKSHGIQAPAFVVAAAESEIASVSCNRGSCCRKESAAPQEFANNVSPDLLVSSAAHLQDHPKATLPETERSEHLGVKYVLGFQTQGCQGQVWGWSVLPWSVIPAPAQPSSSSDPPWDRVLPGSEQAPESHREPPVPPPRVARVTSFVA